MILITLYHYFCCCHSHNSIMLPNHHFPFFVNCNSGCRLSQNHRDQQSNAVYGVDQKVQNWVITLNAPNQKIKQTEILSARQYHRCKQSISLFQNIAGFQTPFSFISIEINTFYNQYSMNFTLEDSSIIDQLVPLQHHCSEDNDLFYQSEQSNQEPSINPEIKNKKKKIKRAPKKKRTSEQANYRKNICGYITKKIVRQFISEEFKDIVSHLCKAHDASYDQAREHYMTTIERITGPSHLPPLFTSTNQAQLKYKMAFRQFFIWFLKERYIRYLLSDGKMLRKEDYIHYKNESLFKLLNEPQFLQNQ